MAFSKARRLSDFIAADGTIPTGNFASSTITSAHLVDGTIAHADLHTNMDLTGKTVLVANASTGDSDTTAANTAFVQQEIAALVDSSPSALNTLNELAAALGDDANFSTTVTNSIGTKLPLAGGTMSGPITMSQSGALHNQFTSTGSSSKISIISADGEQAYINYSGATNEMSAGYDRTSSSFRFANADTLSSAIRMQINSTGNVGVGTDSPDFKLDVLTASADGIRTTSASQTIIRLDTTNTNAAARNWQMAVSSVAHGDFNLTTSTTLGGDPANATSRLYINASGNVGIGTTNPSTKLTVKNDSASTSFGANNIITIQNANTTDNSRMGLAFTGNTNIGSGLALVEAQSYDQSAGHTSLNFSVYNGSWHNDMMVLKAGNVGIGETTPDDTLHVNKSGGTARIRIGSGNDAYYAQKGYLGDTWVFGTGETGDNVDFKISGGNFTTANTGGNFRFFTQMSNGTPTERMHISSEGYIEMNSFSAQPDNTDTSTHRKIEIKANGGGQQTHKRDCFVQSNAGTAQYHWYKIVLGSNNYGRGSNIKYTANWSTGHASGQGFMDGSFMCRARHDNQRITVHGHIVYSRQSIGGSYYGWDYDPDITLYESNANGSGAGLYMRVQGSRTSGYDGATVHALYLEIFGSRQDTASQGIFQVGTSTPADVGSAISRTILS